VQAPRSRGITGGVDVRGCRRTGGHAFDARTGRRYRLDPPARIALLMMQDGKSRQATIDALVALGGGRS